MTETQIRLRRADIDDGAFLGEMLAEAATWDRPTDVQAPPLDELLEIPRVADYVEGWGRLGDHGVIAEHEGVPIGACWFRSFSAAHPGYGFLGESVPGIGLAVRPACRGRGIGSRLLAAAIELASEQGAAALSLSVARDNQRARRLYDRAGFVPVEPEDESVTMRVDLGRD
ncbi:MAG TPA: GNAT family N-acetyltransferase [Thermoleophilia bacterium]|nr:GNAT family N-acetyltransferase [Thermoleophilia bacterium]